MQWCELTLFSSLKCSTLMVQLWLIDYFYIIAGFLFLIAGALYEMAEISIWLIPGGEHTSSNTCILFDAFSGLRYAAVPHLANAEGVFLSLVAAAM